VSDILVIDTNVLVSALLKANSAPAAVIRSLLVGDALLAYDARILLEYREVLARPRFAFSPDLVNDLLRYLTENGFVMAASPWPISVPDPDDAKFLEVCAACGSRSHLITGNVRHYPVDVRRGVSVFTPREWVNKREATFTP